MPLLKRAARKSQVLLPIILSMETRVIILVMAMMLYWQDRKALMTPAVKQAALTGSFTSSDVISVPNVFGITCTIDLFSLPIFF
jgi:hypothetical protein